MVALVFCVLKHSIALLLLCMCLATLVRDSNARPPGNQATGIFSESAQCKTDDELVDLCQRCAKLTKVKDAYKTCCSADLNARKWCYDYVYFGRE
ncbi:uncharacterized protein LOC134751795 [Cydia strobilella]|uniref:uncharacterized protein LOC134751795 n=1 Tax=Cydia strobilella TaxID=1100964 RepID=UPI0030047A58